MVKIVGILNVTPDSFSDGGNFFDPKSAIHHAIKLFSAGASIVDIGAESTRPHAIALRPTEEWQRLEPVLSVLTERYPGQISLDSYHPETIERAAKKYRFMVNDVTGMTNPGMVNAVMQFKPTVIISHFPAGFDIQSAHSQMPVRAMLQVKQDLLAKAQLLESLGLDHDNIILDPGIGFGKTPELNEELLRFSVQIANYPVMIGYSRKRFLGDDRMDLAANLAAGAIAIASGAAYIRVHDVVGHQILLPENADTLPAK